MKGAPAEAGRVSRPVDDTAEAEWAGGREDGETGRKGGGGAVLPVLKGVDRMCGRSRCALGGSVLTKRSGNPRRREAASQP